MLSFDSRSTKTKSDYHSMIQSPPVKLVELDVASEFCECSVIKP